MLTMLTVVDFVFLTVDWLGALFSLLALRKCSYAITWAKC